MRILPTYICRQDFRCTEAYENTANIYRQDFRCTEAYENTANIYRQDFRCTEAYENTASIIYRQNLMVSKYFWHCNVMFY